MFSSLTNHYSIPNTFTLIKQNCLSNYNGKAGHSGILERRHFYVNFKEIIFLPGSFGDIPEGISQMKKKLSTVGQYIISMIGIFLADISQLCCCYWFYLFFFLKANILFQSVFSNSLNNLL